MGDGMVPPSLSSADIPARVHRRRRHARQALRIPAELMSQLFCFRQRYALRSTSVRLNPQYPGTCLAVIERERL